MKTIQLHAFGAGTILRGFLIVVMFAFVPIYAHAEQSRFYENPDIAKILNSIDYYDVGCEKAKTGFDHRYGEAYRHYDEIDNMGLRAVPTLLKAIVVDDIHSKVGFNGYIFVASCLVKSITDEIAPLDWDKIFTKPLGQGLISVADKYAVFQAIVDALAAQNIMQCALVDGNVVCISLR